MNNKFKILILLVPVAFAGASCVKTLDEIGWQADYKLPIIHSELGPDDIFTDSLLVYNPDSSLSLKLEQKVTAFDEADFLDVNDTIATDIFNIPFTVKIKPGQKILDSQAKLVMSLDGILLEKAAAHDAQLKFLVRNTIPRKLVVQFEMISATSGGNTFLVSEEIPPAQDSTASYIEKTINLIDYDIDFTGENHNEFNAVISKTTIWLHNDADSVIISSADSVTVTTIFEKLDVESIHGYFGQQIIHTVDNSSQSTFNNFTSGDFFLDEITAQLEVKNYIGADARLKINEISSYNSRTGANIALENQIIGNFINIKRATLAGSTASDILPSSYQFDLSQSKVREMIENMPTNLNLDILSVLNPLGNSSSGNDFFFSGKPIEANILIEIPLKARLDSLVVQNYSKISFDPDGHINDGEFSIIADNGFPFDVEIQFYLLDDLRQVTDSLLTTAVKASHATLDANGKAIGKQKSILPAPISAAKMGVLRKTNEVLIVARLLTPGTNRFQIYSSYNIDIKLVADINYEF